jgi:hypothetical protein
MPQAAETGAGAEPKNTILRGQVVLRSGLKRLQFAKTRPICNIGGTFGAIRRRSGDKQNQRI